MTHLEKFRELFTEVGCPFKEEARDNPSFGGTTLTLEEDRDGKVVGYSGFYTEFNFNAAGEFINAGAFE